MPRGPQLGPGATASSGYYNFPSLPVGRYNISDCCQLLIVGGCRRARVLPAAETILVSEGDTSSQF